ncbi:MAG: hypothetical protein CVV49_02380 [Spirochaetae bacterium HGW-Spirochaetae-5]|nr:MAG: hypothetical protein CVV49_02380 [Spirochaetae bacterium HGW-Spirochaetae-5]
MKVVHVIKRVETIDNDIKELRKLEKSIARDKSFTTPIFMTIEKQINILLGERIKMLDLQILNPPESFTAGIAGEEEEIIEAPVQVIPEPKKAVKKTQPKESVPVKTAPPVKRKITIPDDDDIPMLTQDQIDAKFSTIKSEEKTKIENTVISPAFDEDDTPLDDTSIKLLDVALEKGSLNKKVMDREKKVRFFRENFPSD